MTIFVLSCLHRILYTISYAVNANNMAKYWDTGDKLFCARRTETVDGESYCTERNINGGFIFVGQQWG